MDELLSFEELALQRWEHAKEQNANWRTMARDDFAFISGNQWEESDKMLLEDQKRPPITFNYSEKMIDAVVGAEISNRHEIHYSPREMSDDASAQIKTEISRWVREQCGAEDEETDAFKEMLICGMGWTETSMDYEDDLDGKIVIQRRDPLEMYWDAAAVKPGLTDARYVFHAFWADEREVKKKWPKAYIFSTEMSDGKGSGHINASKRYSDDNQDNIDKHKDQVRLLHYQCVEREPFYRLINKDGRTQILSEKDFNEIKNIVDEQGWDYVRQVKKVYYQAFFAGDTLLEKRESPCKIGFTFKCITGKRDRNNGVWYGLTRVMKDPQRWSNKWLSQILHIINTNAKGGLLAEVGAFVDPKRAEEEWAKPDSITLLNEGYLGKVIPKTPGAYPSGIDRLMEFALGSLPMVTGINLEALGLANREQAGVLEAQRKQAAYGLLTPIFDSLRRYRKEQGKILLYFINEFISDGRVIRITGPDGQQFVPLNRDPDTIEYDVIVDQSPTAPDVKEKTWQALIQLVPSLLKAGIRPPPDLLDFTPLPASLVQKWKQYAQQQQIDPEQVQQLQQKLQQVLQENQQLKNDNQIEQMKFQQEQQRAQVELQLKVQSQIQEFALERAKLESELSLKQKCQEVDCLLSKQKIDDEIQIKRAQALHDAKIKNIQSGISLAENGQPIMKMDTGPLSEILSEIIKSQTENTQRLEENNYAIIRAINMLEESLNRPKVIIKDKSGKPIGIKPVGD